VPGLDDDIDRLFGLPLDEFTKERNDLARQLKREGDAEGASAVQALAKPTVAAWTVNQLARRDAAAIETLLSAGETLRSVQGRLLAGEDASESLREATARERDAVRALTERAEAALTDTGRPASQAVLERVAATLRAAAADDEGRRLLEAGRLTAELEPTGFGGLVGASVQPEPRRARARKPSAAEKRREREEDLRRRQEIRQQLRELERAARAAEREAEKAEAAAEKARRRAEQARAEADAAAKEADTSG
jgi:hypothetical protein